MTIPVETTKSVKVLEKTGQKVRFVHRNRMARVERNQAKLPAGLSTSLPVDCAGCIVAGNWGTPRASCAMDGNDSEGDCGFAMIDHVDNLRTFGNGMPGFSEIVADEPTLVAQYLKDSGGDNGSDEPMLVGPGGAWVAPNGVAGNSAAIIEDHLDIDYTDVALVQYCIDWFWATNLAWSVPDDVLRNFSPGCSFLSPDTPNPNNGHYTTLSTIDASGNYYNWTWGSYFVASQAFIASVEPSGFVTFSALQFNAAGYDGHGRHVSDVAAAWVGIGGNASLVNPIVAKFPGKVIAPSFPPSESTTKPDIKV